MKIYAGGIEVTISLPEKSFVKFPLYCTKCLRMFPDREFLVAGLRFFPSGTLYSVKAPICSSCHKSTRKPLGPKKHWPVEMTSVPPQATFLVRECEIWRDV